MTLKCHSLLSSYRRVTCERGKNWDRGLYCWKEAKELCTKQLRQIGFSVRVATFPLSTKLVNGRSCSCPLSSFWNIYSLLHLPLFLSNPNYPQLQKEANPLFFLLLFCFLLPPQKSKTFSSHFSKCIHIYIYM